jgi:hypothetical protein
MIGIHSERHDRGTLNPSFAADLFFRDETDDEEEEDDGNDEEEQDDDYQDGYSE